MKIFSLVMIALFANEASGIKILGDKLKTKWGKDRPHPGFEATQQGTEAVEGLGQYSRNVPAIYGGDGSGNDQFMHYMIKNYALEETTPEGKPTGKFYFKILNAQVAAYEIL